MATTKLKTQPCKACDGTGRLPADDVGPQLREERERLGIAQKDVAEAMGISGTYIIDLEKGSRRVTNELLAAYQKALEELKGE